MDGPSRVAPPDGARGPALASIEAACLIGRPPGRPLSFLGRCATQSTRPITFAQEIHVAGRGLPKRGGDKGDLVVTARVVLPKLDEKARADLEKFATEHPQPNPRERMN